MPTEIVEIITRNYDTTLDKLVQTLSKRSKSSYIGAAVFLILIQQIVSYFKVPKNLCHIPNVSWFAIAKSYLKNDSRVNRINELFLPAAHKGNGFFIVSSLFFFLVNHIYRVKSLLTGLFMSVTL